MSNNTKLLASMGKVIARMKGSDKTREARGRTAHRFAKIMRIHGFTHLRDVRQIRGKHIRLFAAHLADAGLAVRTRQNEMGRVRTMIRAARQEQLADSPELENRALGIGGGSRAGRKKAMTPREHAEFCRRARRLRRSGMAALLRLERCLGLRGEEAVCARSDILRRWLVELESEGKVSVTAGTKGGRRRQVRIHDEHREHVKRRLNAALALAVRQGGYLVAPAAEGRPVLSLEQACNIYRSYCVRARIQAHSARYAFAQNQYCGYRRHHHSHRDALACVSRDLGHGSGRGRYVRSVYLRGLDPDRIWD